ncbi:MAG: hypothetical protein QM662_18225, partial [Gordonia sp. (in: high G+C Gram-positive bacteria)]
MRPDAVSTREELGRALTELRVAAGLSVRDVAAAADALQGTVAGWFAGQHAPNRASFEMFRRVVRACGVTDPTAVDDWCAAAERAARRGARKRAESPYRGFARYGTADGARYFGRDDLVTQLVDLIGQTLPAAAADLGARSVVVVGASGVGKSSLVRAGLRSRAATGPLAECQWAYLSPGTDPPAALAAATADLGRVADAPGVLVIDQAEELWTQNTRAARSAFREALTATLIGRRIAVVVVLRADFYGRAAAVPDVAEALAERQILVAPMTTTQLREVIVAPAASVGAQVDDDLVTMLLADVVPASSPHGTAGTGVLPLLSHALRATWEQSDGRRLTVRDYVATGRISGAVEQSAEEVYGSLDPAEQIAARRVLLSMTNVDEDGITRRTVPLAELGTGATGPGVVGRVLETFAAARLVTLTESQAQVTHEALLTAWPRLTEWIDADRERLLLHRRLRALSEPWEASGRSDDLLPSRARLQMFGVLEEAEQTRADGDWELRLDASGRDFLAAAADRDRAADAQEERRRRQLRRFALIAGVFGIVAVLAAVAAVVAGTNAVRQRRAAEDATNRALSRQLAIQSRDLLDRDRFLSAQLAMAAFATAPTVEARSQLIDATAHGVPNRFLGRAGGVALTRAGSLLAAVGAAGQLRLFRVSDEQGITAQLSDVDLHERAGGAVLTPDGRTLYVGGHNRISIWNVTDPAHPVRGADLPGVVGDANGLTLSPDGTMVVASLPDTGVQAWSITPAGPRPVTVPPTVAGVAGGAAFSPDGRLLATASVNRRIDLWRVTAGGLAPAGEIGLPEWRDNELAQGLVFTRDGRLIAALRSHVLAVYDVTDPGAARRVGTFGGFDSYVTAVALDADGTMVAAAAADNTARVFDLADPSLPPRVITGASNPVSVVFAGDRVIEAGDDGRIQDWPADDGGTAIGTGSVWQIPVDAAGRRLLAADTGTDGRITQWELGPGTMRQAGPDLLPAPGEVYSGAVTVTPSGKTAAIGTVSGTVRFADFS